jgi:hypothetical protein
MPRLRSQIHDAYGGFNDLASFRTELGIPPEDLDDVHALTIINGDMAEQKRIAENKARTAAEEKARLAAELDATKQARTNAERELELERNRRLSANNPRSIWESPGLMSDFLVKEKLKQEVRDDLWRENKLRMRELEREKELSKMWNNADKPLRPLRSRSKPRSRSRSRPKKSRPKSKSRLKSKSKSRR